MMNKRKNRLIFFVLLTAVFLTGCTISHEFGPYKGKVVDKETGEPIEGAVVFMQFYTRFQLNPGGPTSKYADAIEVLTDERGEFAVPAYRINEFRPFHLWDIDGYIIIFKPGYGAYPNHMDVSPRFDPGYSIPKKEFVTIKLPKLKTREERRENQSHASFTTDIPIEKWNNLFRLRNIEREQAGLKPFDSPE